MTDTLPLAPDGVFLTVQGEGLLLGEPTVFVRLAGCSVGCDTDYRLSRRLAPADIAREAAGVAGPHARWCWLTGGEPTDHPLGELVGHLRRAGFRVALATAGVRADDGVRVRSGHRRRPVPGWQPAGRCAPADPAGGAGVGDDLGAAGEHDAD